MKNRILFSTAIGLWLLTWAQGMNAQNWAGPDTTICQSNGVVLGTNETPDEYCFHWSPATGLSDITAKRPFAQPDKTTEYTLVAIGPDFSNKVVDKVKVTVATGGVVLAPSFTEPDGRVNQAHAHLTSKPGGAVVIWSIEGPDYGCVINSTTGNISYCNSPGEVTIRATISGDEDCYAEGTFLVNVGVKQVYAIDAQHPTRKATEGGTLHLVGHNDVKLKAIPNDGESFGDEQPDWTGSTVLPPTPYVEEWIHDEGLPLQLHIEAGGKTVNVQRHQPNQVSVGGFSHTLITLFNAVKNFIKPPESVTKGHQFKPNATSACSPYSAKFDHNIAFKSVDCERFNSPELGVLRTLEGEISAKVTGKICFPFPWSSPPNPVFVWSSYIVAEGGAAFGISAAYDESKEYPAEWRPKQAFTATSSLKLGVGGEAGLLLPGDVFGITGSIFGGTSIQTNIIVDLDSVSIGAKWEPVYVEGGLKVWFNNPNNQVLALGDKMLIMDPVALKPRRVVDLTILKP